MNEQYEADGKWTAERVVRIQALASQNVDFLDFEHLAIIANGADYPAYFSCQERFRNAIFTLYHCQRASRGSGPLKDFGPLISMLVEYEGMLQAYQGDRTNFYYTSR